MGGEGGDPERESERDGGWAGIVAKVAGVGGPRGAADERRAHDGNGERHRIVLIIWMLPIHPISPRRLE